MALKLTSRQECFCIGREQARAVRDFAAMVDSTWGRSGVHDARVALLRLLLQVSTASAALNTDQPHCAVQHCRPHVTHAPGVHKFHNPPGARWKAIGWTCGQRRWVPWHTAERAPMPPLTRPPGAGTRPQPGRSVHEKQAEDTLRAELAEQSVAVS